jgi:hypothetical protein
MRADEATWPVSVLMFLIASITIFAVLAARETAPIVASLDRQQAMMRDFVHPHQANV